MKILQVILLFFIMVQTSTGLASDNIFNSLFLAKQHSKNHNTQLLVIFSTNWCKFCSTMKTDISNNIEHLKDYTICYIDSDEHKILSKKYNVKTIPDYMILQEDRIVKRKTGYITFNDFTKWLE